MTLADVAWRNVTRSFRTYTLYLVSVASNVFAFYLFSSAWHDPIIDQVIDSTQAFKTGMIVASVVIAIFAAVFLWYSSSFFLRRRTREIALYGLFGVSQARVSAMLFAENMLTGTASLALGLGAGILFSKLFLMALLRVLAIDARVTLSVSPAALIETAILFVALLVVASLAATWRVFRTRLADAFRAERAAEGRPRRAIGLGIVSLVVLVSGYAIASTTTPTTLLPYFLLVSALTIFGTWAFARGGGGLVLTALGRSARVRASGPRLVALGNLSFRIGSNARVFFAIAIVSTVSMVALGVGLNLKYWTQRELEGYSSFTFSFLDDASGEVAGSVESILTSSGAEVTSRAQSRLLRGSWANKWPVDGDAMSSRLRFLPASDYLALLEGADERRARGVIASIGAGEAALVDTNDTRSRALLGKELRATFGESEEALGFPLAARLTSPGVMLPSSIMTLVIRDADYVRIAAVHPDAERYLIGVALRDSRGAAAVVDSLIGAVEESAELYSRTSLEDMLRSFDMALLVGILMGLVFLVSSCSILHFKQLMDAAEDAARYETLFKIGMGEGDARRIATYQVLPMYALPLGLASAHSAVALAVMGRVLGADFALPIASVILCFAVIFLAFGKLTTRSCLRLMLSRRA